MLYYMQNTKRFFVALFSLAAVFVLNSCNDEDKSNNNTVKNYAAEGDVVYGGTLNVNGNSPVQTLYPHAIIDIISARVASQVYEGLVKMNPRDLSIIPCIAEKWELNEEGTTYTFYLKKGVMFHDDPCFSQKRGREVKAGDVKYSLELLSKPSRYNLNYASSIKGVVKGSEEFYNSFLNNSGINELASIKVIDDYTIKIQLEQPNTSFLYLLAQPSYSILAKEAVEQYGPLLKNGTGPFIYATNEKPSEQVILIRNHSYHASDELGNKLPYLDTIRFSFMESKLAELEAYKDKKLDLILGLSSESIREVVENKIVDFQSSPPKFILDRSPEMATQYYDLNTVNSVFKNKKVRQAFNYAINREKILNEILKGEAFTFGNYGITPPSFKDYDVTQIKGYGFDPEKARILLAEAGFPAGKNFPKVKLEISASASKHAAVAFEIIRQLREVLNIYVDLEMVPFATKLENSKYAKGDIYRSAWIADYPSPENFLMLFYGKDVPESLEQPSFPNVTRYQNPVFDSLFEAGRKAKTDKEKLELFLEAEKVMMDDAPVIILWYDENYRLYQSNVRNFFPNPLNYWDFTQVYKKSPEGSDL
jgi:oligopeptide transport system substrate-binding protein